MFIIYFANFYMGNYGNFAGSQSTDWLSGSGGSGETRLNDYAFAGKSRLQ
jgi:hypothetical protein